MSGKIILYNKQNRFNDFSECVHYCNLCPRMQHRNRVLSEMNGNLNTDVLFIAEAPGRLGADKTGIPLYGDKTGDNFQKFLDHIGWRREDIFITNAVLCNPRNSEGNNDTPNLSEIHNCSVFLEMTISLIKPKILVTLGRIALDSLKFIFSHNYSLRENVGTSVLWNNYTLFPLYHPSPRALLHRSLSVQVNDYISLSSQIQNPVRAVAENVASYYNKQTLIDFSQEIDFLKLTFLYILQQLKSISFFKATKLLYLCDLRSIETFGNSITGSIYLRQKEGPWLPKLRDITDKLNGKELRLYFLKQIPLLKSLQIDEDFTLFSQEKKQCIDELIATYGTMSDKYLKIAVYRTKPMQYILSQEKKNIKMLNKAVLYKDKTIIDLENSTKNNLLF